ncbi:MAG TPA: hypothetical protein VMF05_09680 [Stellaceae bacterium]|nr:hypothetical protein [Stellaceae bacterium]
MHPPRKTTTRSGKTRTVIRAAAAALFSVALGASGPALAEPHGGGFHGGGGHGGFHGGGFHGGAFHAGRFHGGFHGGYVHHGWGYGFYPGLGLGVALGAAYPWGWGDYPPAYGYYGPAYGYYGNTEPYAGQVWYYCSNPTGYYPYVAQCFAPWQAVPAG